MKAQSIPAFNVAQIMTTTSNSDNLIKLSRESVQRILTRNFSLSRHFWCFFCSLDISSAQLLRREDYRKRGGFLPQRISDRLITAGLLRLEPDWGLLFLVSGFA
jgi:hypothetical protein